MNAGLNSSILNSSGSRIIPPPKGEAGKPKVQEDKSRTFQAFTRFAKRIAESIGDKNDEVVKIKLGENGERRLRIPSIKEDGLIRRDMINVLYRTKKTKAANNQVRTVFLRALIGKFGNLDLRKLPENQLEALGLADYIGARELGKAMGQAVFTLGDLLGMMETGKGTGKPLTVRQILKAGDKLKDVKQEKPVWKQGTDLLSKNLKEYFTARKGRREPPSLKEVFEGPKELILHDVDESSRDIIDRVFDIMAEANSSEEFVVRKLGMPDLEKLLDSAPFLGKGGKGHVEDTPLFLEIKRVWNESKKIVEGEGKPARAENAKGPDNLGSEENKQVSLLKKGFDALDRNLKNCCADPGTYELSSVLDGSKKRILDSLPRSDLKLVLECVFAEIERNAMDLTDEEDPTKVLRAGKLPDMGKLIDYYIGFIPGKSRREALSKDPLIKELKKVWEDNQAALEASGLLLRDEDLAQKDEQSVQKGEQSVQKGEAKFSIGANELTVEAEEELRSRGRHGLADVDLSGNMPKLAEACKANAVLGAKILNSGGEYLSKEDIDRFLDRLSNGLEWQIMAAMMSYRRGHPNANLTQEQVRSAMVGLIIQTVFTASPSLAKWFSHPDVVRDLEKMVRLADKQLEGGKSFAKMTPLEKQLTFKRELLLEFVQRVKAEANLEDQSGQFERKFLEKASAIGNSGIFANAKEPAAAKKMFKTMCVAFMKERKRHRVTDLQEESEFLDKALLVFARFAMSGKVLTMPGTQHKAVEKPKTFYPLRELRLDVKIKGIEPETVSLVNKIAATGFRQFTDGFSDKEKNESLALFAKVLGACSSVEVAETLLKNKEFKVAGEKLNGTALREEIHSRIVGKKPGARKDFEDHEYDSGLEFGEYMWRSFAANVKVMSQPNEDPITTEDIQEILRAYQKGQGK